MDAAHPLLEPVRVPGQVPVDHDPAELQIDALAGRVGRDHELGRAAELLLGRDAVLQLHTVMNVADTVAPLLDLAGQVNQCVAVLGEDQNLLVAVGEHLVPDERLKLAQLLFRPAVHGGVGLRDQAVELGDFGLVRVRLILDGLFAQDPTPQPPPPRGEGESPSPLSAPGRGRGWGPGPLQLLGQAVAAALQAAGDGVE